MLWRGEHRVARGESQCRWSGSTHRAAAKGRRQSVRPRVYAFQRRLRVRSQCVGQNGIERKYRHPEKRTRYLCNAAAYRPCAAPRRNHAEAGGEIKRNRAVGWNRLRTANCILAEARGRGWDWRNPELNAIGRDRSLLSLKEKRRNEHSCVSQRHYAFMRGLHLHPTRKEQLFTVAALRGPAPPRELPLAATGARANTP